MVDTEIRLIVFFALITEEGFLISSCYCQENALVIANTLFQQNKRRLYTWTSPDGQNRNQIDYILCSQRWRRSIQYPSLTEFIGSKTHVKEQALECSLQLRGKESTIEEEFYLKTY